MPFLAILRHELQTLRSSWLVWLWLALSFLFALLSVAGHWTQMQTAPFIATLVFPYLFAPWSLVVLVVAVIPVSGSRAEEMADGLLSRPVTRYEYLLAAWAARVLVVLGVYLIVTVPAILLVTFGKRPVLDDMVTLYGVVASLGVVGLVMTLQVSLGFLLGTLLRRTLFAAVILVSFWCAINLILNVFSLESFSTLSLGQAIPTLLRESWNEAPQDPADEDQDAENAANEEEMEMIARFAANPFAALSGAPPEKKPPPKSEEGQFFESDNFQDFSLPWVILGYGLPTLLALGLTTLCFCWRDL